MIDEESLEKGDLEGKMVSAFPQLACKWNDGGEKSSAVCVSEPKC